METNHPFNITEEIEIRGIPRYHLIEYIKELGGKTDCIEHKDKGMLFYGKEWNAILKPEDSISFSKVFTIPRTYAVFLGSEESVADTVAKFRRKIMRAGG